MMRNKIFGLVLMTYAVLALIGYLIVVLTKGC